MAEEEVVLDLESKEEAPEGEAPAPPKKDDAEEKYRNLQRALDEERRRRKEVEEAYTSTVLPLKTQLEEWRASQQQAVEEDGDPLEVVTKEVRLLKAEREQERRLLEEQRSEQSRQAKFLSDLSSQVAQYRTTTPDYDDAYRFVVEKRMKDYQVFGYSPVQSQQFFDNEAMQIAQSAMANGKNPGEVVYALARQWGWNGSQEGDDEGKHPSVSPVSRTLSGHGGKPAKTESLTLSDLERMPTEEFDKLWAKLKRAGKLG